MDNQIYRIHVVDSKSTLDKCECCFLDKDVHNIKIYFRQINMKHNNDHVGFYNGESIFKMCDQCVSMSDCCTENEYII